MARSWEDIRSDYVNGNISDAKEGLYQQSKAAMLGTIAEALETHLACSTIISTSGDLTDLLEIIRKIRRAQM